jgi:hypothetical protein
METDPVPETSHFLVSRIPDVGKKSKTPVILSGIHHRQILLESFCYVRFSQQTNKQTNKQTQNWVNRLDRRNFGNKKQEVLETEGDVIPVLFPICILEVPASNLSTQTAYPY